MNGWGVLAIFTMLLFCVCMAAMEYLPPRWQELPKHIGAAFLGLTGFLLVLMGDSTAITLAIVFFGGAVVIYVILVQFKVRHDRQRDGG